MKRRKWDPEVKTKIVLEVLQGRRLADVCMEYEISQAQYYSWREQFLSGCSKAFEVKKDDAREQRLKRENGRLKQLVGELTVELKKTTFSTCRSTTVTEQDSRRSAACAADSTVKVRPSVLGLSSRVGLAEVSRGYANQRQEGLSLDAGK